MANVNVKLKFDGLEKAQKGLGLVTGAVGGLAKSVFSIKGALVGLAGAFAFTKTIEAAKRQEDAVNGLNVALQLTGKYSEQTSKSLQQFASSLQATTKFGDEAILEAQSLIQSLGNLDEQGLKRATSATLDLAAALRVDLNTAAGLVGKAAAGEVGTFSRYGLIIKKGADNAETLTNALTALESKFGGAAAGQINTYSGATQQLSNTFGDLLEEIGFIVTKSGLGISAIHGLQKVFVQLGEIVKRNGSSLQDLVLNGINLLLDSLGFLAKSLAGTVYLYGQLMTVGDRLKVVVNNISLAFLSYQDAVVSSLSSINKLLGRDEAVASFEAQKVAIEGVKSAIQGINEDIKKGIIENVKDAEKAAYDIMRAASKAIKTVKKEVENASRGGDTLLKNLSVDVDVNPEIDEKNLSGKFSDIAKNFGSFLKTQFDSVLKFFKDNWGTILSSGIQGALSVASSAISNLVGSLSGDTATSKEKEKVELDFSQANETLNRQMEDLKDSLAAKLSAGLLSQTSYDQQLAKIEQSFADTIQTNNDVLASEQARLENQEKAGGALVGFGSQLLSAIPIFGEAATSILQSSLSGADQITALVSGIVSELPRITQTIMEALPALIDGFIAALPKIVDSLKSIIPQLINAFVTAIGPIIDGIIELLPVIIDALINALPDVIVAIIDAIPQIIQVLADKIPLLIQVLIQNLPNFIGAIIRALPQIVTSLANMMPMVVISLVTELIKQVPQIILEIIRNIPYVITNLINGLWNGLVQMFTSLVNWINGFLNPFSGDGKFLGLFAKGGEVPPGFQNDSYPARLTSGEIVVDRSTTDKLKGFLDSPLDLSAREGGGDDRTIMLLSKILEKLDSPQKIETSVQFRQQTLADILINLSRTGTRITA